MDSGFFPPSYLEIVNKALTINRGTEFTYELVDRQLIEYSDYLYEKVLELRDLMHDWL